MLPPIAAWLVARPLRAVLGLVITLAVAMMMPLALVFSSAVMAMLVLYAGARIAVLQVFMAAGVLAAISFLAPGSLPGILVNALFAWLPAFMLAWLLQQSRSLNLTLQVSVIVALALMLGFYVVVDDPTAFWTDLLSNSAAMIGEQGFTEQAAFLLSVTELLAPKMTMLSVLAIWSMMALAIVLGYALYQALPGKSAEFGRFCDLNFGRILALVLAVSSVLALIIGAEWLRNFAFVAFAIFWLQGLSMVHWLHVVGILPVIVLVVIYAMLPFLQALLVMALAVLGYTDVWLNYRTRIGRNMARK